MVHAEITIRCHGSSERRAQHRRAPLRHAGPLLASQQGDNCYGDAPPPRLECWATHIGLPEPRDLDKPNHSRTCQIILGSASYL